jgi:glutathione S-transferase
MLELWELGGRDDCRFSTFSWRTRLALHHKGLPFAVHPVAVSDKAAVGFSGQSKVPILKHDGHVIPDSWAIALYLEKEFPERPTLFGGEVGQTLTHVFNVWADRELIPALIPFLMRDVLDCVSEADGAHLRRQIESAMKKSLEELSAGREQAVQAFRCKLQPVRKALEAKDYLGGAAPTYAELVRTPAMGARRVADESARRWRRGRSGV